MNYLQYLLKKSQLQKRASKFIKQSIQTHRYEIEKQEDFQNGKWNCQIVLIIRQITLLINVIHQKHNIYMQKEKKQSQLLSTLSEILKLYHKYLLYSLRSDIAYDRKLGMLENIRDRVRSILNKQQIQCNNFGCASVPDYVNQLETGEDRGRNFIKDNGSEIKLVNRFLGRVSQKIKGYMEQFVGYEVPEFLTQNLRMIQKMSNNLVLQQLLRNLFAISNEPSRQTKKQSRKNSSTQPLINEAQKKGKTPESSQAGAEKEVKRGGFMSGFTKKSNEIQQIINLVTIIQLDEKELRKKYFAILQYSSQFLNEQSKAVNSSNSYHLHSQNNIIIHATNINFHRQQQLSDQGSISKLNLVVSNASYYNIGNNNPLYIQMMERNKAIAQMIRKYESNYDKHRKRQNVKVLRNEQKQRQKDRFKNKLASLSLEKYMNGHQSGQQFYCQQQRHDSIQNIATITPKQCDAEDQKRIQRLTNKQNGRQKIMTMDKIIEKKQNEIVQSQEHHQMKKKQSEEKRQKREQAKNSNEKLHRNSSHENNSSLPELKNIEKVQSNSYNPYGNNSKIKKAQKLLRITKPKLRMGIIQQSKSNIRHKQKSLSTAAIAHDHYGTHNFANFGHAHTHSLNSVVDPNTQSSCQINGNHIVNLNSYTEQELKIREGQQYSDTAINTCLYNNLNAVIKPKQLLNRFLSKVNSSASVAEHQTKILNLSKIQFISANSSLSQINHDHNAVQKKSKKTSIHRQQLEQRRAKVEALYQKQRPTQLGFLSSNLNLPRIEDVEGPSFLMACRSYQRAVQFNHQNSASLAKNAGQKQQIVIMGGK